MNTLSLFDRPDGDGGEKDSERVFRVAELNRAVRSTLEAGWGDVWVEGELSDVTRAASGHVYFTLNDDVDAAQIRGVMFRGDASRAKATLESGARVRMRGSLSLYEPRGSFQIIVRLALPAGAGDLHAEFERIRKRLEAEGLLDVARKRPLPMFPRTVGVVTSASGAAVHDVLRVTAGRCPVRLVIADCRVQGKDAPDSIIDALTAIQRLPELEVVLLVRGGGSAEDLWSFNDERVARAIAACRVPVVAGIGHESDVTIADLVADVRAATPSNAAELTVPDRSALTARIEASRRHLERAFEAALGRARLRLEKLQRHMEDPRRAVAGIRNRFAALRHTLERLALRRLARAHAEVSNLRERLGALDPRRVLRADRERLVEMRARLRETPGPFVGEARLKLAQLASTLEALSPLAVLARGYAVTLHGASGRALLRSSDAKTGDMLTIRLHEGSLAATVTGIDAGAPKRKPSSKRTRSKR
ncbi:MAG: exodeoxyribonuclease VII large subunit [Myxococcales bacterium]|nr:exodeoxyribonuclease VII large subunit [Myxococcales bacterium]